MKQPVPLCIVKPAKNYVGERRGARVPVDQSQRQVHRDDMSDAHMLEIIKRTSVS
jgi:hypothetical protein